MATVSISLGDAKSILDVEKSPIDVANNIKSYGSSDGGDLAKTTKLTPDKDELLFEIEDHSYLLEKFVSWLLILILLSGVLFIFFDGDILAMRNEGHRGYLGVTLGFFIIVTYGLKMFIYIIKGKRYKIQFYKDYIYKENEKFKLPLYDIEEGYISKYNIKEYKMRTFNGYLSYFGLIVIAIIFILGITIVGAIKMLTLISIFATLIFSPFLIGFFLYSLLKTKKYVFQINSLILINKKDNTYGVSIPLNIISKEDEDKINNYIIQYLHTDINKIEKIIIVIPAFAKKNIKFDEKI